MERITGKVAICEIVLANTEEYGTQAFWESNEKAEKDAGLIIKSVTDHLNRQIKKSKLNSLSAEVIYEHCAAKGEVKKVIVLNHLATEDLYFPELINQIKSDLTELISLYRHILEEEESEINSVIIAVKGENISAKNNDRKIHFVQDKSTRTFLYDIIDALHGRARPSNTSFSLNLLEPHKPDSQTTSEPKAADQASQSQDLETVAHKSTSNSERTPKPESTFTLTSKPAPQTIASSSDEPMPIIFSVNSVDDRDNKFCALIDGKIHVLNFDLPDREILLDAQKHYQTIRASVCFYKKISRGRDTDAGGKATGCEIFTFQENLEL